MIQALHTYAASWWQKLAADISQLSTSWNQGILKGEVSLYG
jgi:hypothetical protein